jgi:hypothetical protein
MSPAPTAISTIAKAVAADIDAPVAGSVPVGSAPPPPPVGPWIGAFVAGWVGVGSTAGLGIAPGSEGVADWHDGARRNPTGSTIDDTAELSGGSVAAVDAAISDDGGSGSVTGSSMVGSSIVAGGSTIMVSVGGSSEASDVGDASTAATVAWPNVAVGSGTVVLVGGGTVASESEGASVAATVDSVGGEPRTTVLVGDGDPQVGTVVVAASVVTGDVEVDVVDVVGSSDGEVEGSVIAGAVDEIDEWDEFDVSRCGLVVTGVSVVSGWSVVEGARVSTGSSAMSGGSVVSTGGRVVSTAASVVSTGG